MGIDIYAQWRGQTDAERRAQITGFSIAHGHVGYLREAYHGKPYATMVLVPEAFRAGDRAPKIPAATMRARLPDVFQTAIERERKVYANASDSDETLTVLKSFRDFVELCERKERETGEPCTILASA